MWRVVRHCKSADLQWIRSSIPQGHEGPADGLAIPKFIRFQWDLGQELGQAMQVPF